DRCGGPAADTDQRLGLVEELHHGHDLAPLDHKIDASPRVPLVKCAGTEHRRVECAADRQHAVANHLSFEPLWRAPPQPDVFWIEPGICRVELCALDVCGRRHDEFVYRLEP